MLHIATMNVDTLRTPDSIDSVITNLQTNDIDIACVQETHNNRNDHIERGGAIRSSLVGEMIRKDQNH